MKRILLSLVLITAIACGDKKEKEIHIFMSIFLDYNFLQNTPPEDQQDSDICYLLCILYEIKNNIELCNKFYNFISKQV